VSIITPKTDSRHAAYCYMIGRSRSTIERRFGVVEPCNGQLHLLMYRSDEKPKDYAEYLLMHQNGRDKAYVVYRKFMNRIAVEAARWYFILLVIPLIIFYKYALFIIIPVIFIHLGFIIHRQTRLGHGMNFFTMVTQRVIFKKIYAKD